MIGRRVLVCVFASGIGRPLILAVFAVVLALSPDASAADSPTYQRNIQIYQAIKSIERQFPIPQPEADVEVGTFDAMSALWEGLESSEEEYYPAPNKPPRTRQVVPHIEVNAVNFNLVFKVSNRQGVFRVKIANVWHDAAPGANRIVIGVGRSTDISWTLQSGSRVMSDKFVIDRPPVVGAGAFTIPALPVTVIYEPPQDLNRQNTASYTTTVSLGSTTVLTHVADSSTTKSIDVVWDPLSQFSSQVKTMSDMLSDAPGTVAKGIAGGMKAINAALGQATRTQTDGTIDVTTGALALNLSASEQILPAAHLGPGHGDLIVFLKNAKVVWLANETSVHLFLLDYEREAIAQVDYLSANVNKPEETKLSSETVSALLALDWFLRPGPTPPQQYFVKGYEMMGGSQVDYNMERIITKADTAAHTDYSIFIDDYKEGLLRSVFGLDVGPAETKTVKFTAQETKSRLVQTGHSVKASLSLFAAVGEKYAVDVYHDPVFGAFVMYPVPQLRKPVLKGRIASIPHRPLAHRLVTLTVGGRTYETHTDKNGNYAFFSASIPSGPGVIRVSGESKLRAVRVR